MTVVDNSVLVDVALRRRDLDDFGNGPLSTLCLIDSEFLHTLRRIERLGLIDPDRASEVMHWFSVLQLMRYPLGPRWERAWELRTT